MTPAETAFLESLIGKPYRLGAEGPDAFDCYGLARHVQRVVMGHDMPPAARKDMVGELRAAGERRRWARVEAPAPWDLVLMGNTVERQTHLGVWVVPGRRGQVLHAHETMNVCLHDPASLRAIGFADLRFYRRRPA